MKYRKILICVLICYSICIYAHSQSSPACPDGICPGLGNSFYLPEKNALSINTSGIVFFKDTSMGTCAKLSPLNGNAYREFKSASSMKHYLTNVVSEASLGGSYKSQVLTAKGTAEGMSGMSSDVTTTFNSVQMDIYNATQVVDFILDSDCFSSDNIDPEFLSLFEALPIIPGNEASNSAHWSPYVQFLEDSGSHILTSAQIGSRFQHWEHSSSKDSDIANTLKIKACAEVEGITEEGAGWSVSGCAAHSENSKKKALEAESNTKRLVLGGTESTRAGLQNAVNESTLSDFIKSAEEGSAMIKFQFKPIWDLLERIYLPQCATDGNDSDACKNLQKATSLQAAYDGWLAVGCPEKKDGNKKYIQRMKVAGKDSHGIETYQCSIAKTGCRSGDDCRVGGAFASQCYCYGKGCIDKGSHISGTDFYRDKVRGSKSGGTNKGVNKSCGLDDLGHCGCDKGWAGGLPHRTVYLQSEN